MTWNSFNKPTKFILLSIVALALGSVAFFSREPARKIASDENPKDKISWSTKGAVAVSPPVQPTPVEVPPEQKPVTEVVRTKTKTTKSIVKRSRTETDVAAQKVVLAPEPVKAPARVETPVIQKAGEPIPVERVAVAPAKSVEAVPAKNVKVIPVEQVKVIPAKRVEVIPAERVHASAAASTVGSASASAPEMVEVVTVEEVEVSSPPPVAAPVVEIIEVPVQKAAVPVVEPIPGPVAEVQEDPSGLFKEFWIWGGWGPNFSSVNQSVPGLSNIDFGGIGKSSTSLNAGFWVLDDVGLNLSYRDTPGEAKSSQTMTVNNGDYHWKTIGVEVLVRSEKNVASKQDLNFRLGIQQTQLPFLVPINAASINMTEASITNLTLGFEYKKLLREKFRFEWMLRYQQPIASSGEVGETLTVKPRLTFDTSIGTAYEFSKNIYLGVYWYNQYQKFNFDYNNNAGVAFTGSQTTFFSTFDLRLGVEF
jgi:hypothetical protein